MTSSFEKSVKGNPLIPLYAHKGATKIKLAVPKAKYIDHILLATRTGDAGLGEVFRALTTRLHDPSWTTVFKALLVVHIMIRDGEKNATLDYLGRSPRLLDTGHLPGGIPNYGKYLQDRAVAFEKTRVDYVADPPPRSLTLQKGLLKHVEILQKQIGSLLRCKFSHAPEHDIALAAFKLLIADLKPLFQSANEGVINVLEHYFEMPLKDAERALSVYKVFVKQTHGVIDYFNTARRWESITRLPTPLIKHAPTSLTKALEEYLNDPDFEENRKRYLERKTQSSKVETKNIPDDKTNPFSPSFHQDTNLIDLSSQPQPTYSHLLTPPTYPLTSSSQPSSYPQQLLTSYPPEPPLMSCPPLTSSYPTTIYPQQPAFTGAGFGGFTRDTQSFQIPHQLTAQTNPFRTSTQTNIFPNQTGPPSSNPFATHKNTLNSPQSTNPFRQSIKDSPW